jgi:hypothetical protein
MQAAKKETVFEFPDGGIADFYMTDEQFAELERREEVGHGGIANVHHIADRIAEYGRYGDDTLAHVETGELIVPRALLDKNPALKESILEHLEELGVEDPERYIVGSEFNSLNPDTQLPEFFFKKIFKKAKKAFKKVVKGVKKTFKKIGKVLKKASAVVLPIVLNAAFPGMGAIMTGALSGGISTLIQGGNLKDALKSAALGSITGAIAKGGFNKITGKSGFMDTIKSEVSNVGNLKAQFSTAGGILDPATYSSAAAAAPAAGAQAAPVTSQPLPEIQGPPTASEAALIGEPTFAEQAATAAENIDLTKSFPQLDAPLDPSLSNFQTDSVLDLLEGQAPAGTAATSTLPQSVRDYIQTAPGRDEFGNRFVGDQIVSQGGLQTPDRTLVELAAQSGSQVQAPTFAEQAQAAIDRVGAKEAILQDPRTKIPGMDATFDQKLLQPKVDPSQFTARPPAVPSAAPPVNQGFVDSVQEVLDKTPDFTVNQVVKEIEPPGFFEALGRGDLQGAFAPGSTLPKPSALEDQFGLSVDKAKQAISEATPGMIRTYAPAAAVAGLAAQQMGAFETPVYDPITIQELEASQGQTGSDLVTAFPEIYRVQDLEVKGSEGPYRQDTLYAYDPQIGLYPVNPFGRRSQAQRMQSGGAAFPRRTGGIDPSEGVPNQDSVRAMLMPGEFVMTTKAVRGMSQNGDSREGIKNMYSMMRNLEARERKMG